MYSRHVSSPVSHTRYLEEGIVDNTAEIICRRTVGLDHHLIFDLVGTDLYLAVDHVVELDQRPFSTLKRYDSPLPVTPDRSRKALGRRDIEPFRLRYRLFIPRNSKPGKRTGDLLKEFVFRTDPVRIFDTQKKRPLMNGISN